MKILQPFFLLLLMISTQVMAQPRRKAVMGALLKETASGLLIDSVYPNTTMSAAALQKGDLVTAINTVSTNAVQQYNTAVAHIRANDKVQIQFSRNGINTTKTVEAVMKPFESSEIADIQYDWVKFRNGYLRAITRKPKGKTNVPSILLIPGYGCGTIENYSSSYNGKLMNEWIKNGYAVVTIEKSGVGDSEGCEPCTEVDIVTDIESFSAGYVFMEQLPFVDKSKLYIWGHSMGGAIAPEVAKRHLPKGVMVFASVYRPWSEFLLEMHRVQKPLLANLNYRETETFVRQIQKIYYEFFVLKKSPEELYQVPEYKALVESEIGYRKGSNNMWGRHWRFWQQLDSLNLAESWQKLNCPVLVLHGTADYSQCSLVEPMLIKETVNAAHPGNASLVIIDDLDHFMMNSKDYRDAAKNFSEQQYTKGNFNYKLADATVKWLQQNMQAKN